MQGHCAPHFGDIKMPDHDEARNSAALAQSIVGHQVTYSDGGLDQNNSPNQGYDNPSHDDMAFNLKNNDSMSISKRGGDPSKVIQIT